MKLTNEKRDQIKAAILSECFDSKMAAVAAVELQLADQAHDIFLGKHKETFESLPAEWHGKSPYIRVTINGQRRTLCYGPRKTSKAYSVPGEHWRRQPENCELTIKDSHPLAKKISKWDVDTEKLQRERNELSAHIGGVLASANTVKQLIDLWPESKPYVDKLLPIPTTGKALVDIRKINQRIDSLKAQRDQAQ